MKNIGLYLLTIMIWGTSWIGIKYQLGVVDPMVSVVYRFGLATVMLGVFCRLRGMRFKFSLKTHLSICGMGLCLFSINYWLMYRAEETLTSGLMAVLFSSLVFINMINGALFLKARMEWKMIAGGLIGIAGIILIFLPEIRSFDAGHGGLTGICFGMTAVFLCSFGNIVSASNSKQNIPVIQANALGMLYGTLVLFLVALFMGKEFTFSPTPIYVGSLVYLALFASIFAFGAFLTLVGNIGPDKAAYAIMVVPVVALLVSTVMEGYSWTPLAICGLVLVVAGNFLALHKPSAPTS